MLAARTGHEISVRLPNQIGTLHVLSKLLAEHGIDVLATNNIVEGDHAMLRLITDDPDRTADALREHGYEPAERSVILLDAPHRPGILRHVTERLKFDGVDLRELYATALPGAEVCRVVLTSSDDERAVVLLND